MQIFIFAGGKIQTKFDRYSLLILNVRVQPMPKFVLKIILLLLKKIDKIF